MNFPGAGMFNYLTFRASIAFVLSLLFATVFGRKIIDKLKKLQIGETIRDLGLEGQESKKNTPTMGGIIILFAIIISCLLIGVLSNIYMLLMLFTTIFMGCIGFLDDYIKVFRKNKDGLSGRYKIVGQVGIGLVVGLVLYFSPQAVIIENTSHRVNNVEQTEVIRYTSKAEKSTQTTIPFFKNNNFDYADLFGWAGDNKQLFGWLFFVLVTIFIVTAMSNGANLTDGIDGLAAGTSAIQGVALGILAYVSGNINNAGYLNIMYIPGSGELLVFAAAFIGATIGFLWYNAHPAQVFMGDTGSLALGGIIAVFAIIIRKEILLPILAGIFLVESLSVILQRYYFKFTKKRYGEGTRIFKMAPLHHHFQKSAGEISGIVLLNKPLNKVPESKLSVRFWLIGLMLAVLTLATLKMR
jgi:phospho-N-acetylmuramoyl-pentapeptide-transferase